MNAIEEGTELRPDFAKLEQIGRAGQQVVPVVLQDADSGDVLFVGYANEEAMRETLRRREAVLWSTSRDELWHKGATSGDVLSVEEVRVNCEQNSLVYVVRLAGEGACHTKTADGVTRPSCYYRRIANDGDLAFL